ncbi:MAG: bile acid:sodium symporter [Muribaculaceae bacterium]|nr:bile acid:sodium symporter [Muribaculaceae bacterium]
MKFGQFLRDWALVLAILTGILAYFVYVAIPLLDSTHALAMQAVGIVQPALIFAMLFLTFCRVSPRELRLCGWHLWLLLIQGGAFTALALVVMSMPHGGWRVILEGAMLCLICPTATAAAVITRRLGGDVAHVTTYTILINILGALLIPALTPLVHPEGTLGFAGSAVLIMREVFPLLLLPLAGALLLRWKWPKACEMLGRHAEWSFYLWAVALALAMTVTTRSIVHSTVGLATQGGLVGVSLVCCALQFWLGRKIGRRYGDAITAGQALGQKNTVFIIWLGYTFFTPVTAVIGGFYSIWHNLVNTWQLYRHDHR